MSSRKSTSRLGRQIQILAAAVSALFFCSRPAAAERVLGLDISAWQGNLSQTTWNNFHNVEDRDFVFIRSSRGGTTGYYNQSDPNNNNNQNTLSQRYDDPYFIQNITRATAAGMFAGPYHFSRPDVIASTQNSGGIANNGTDEANHFIQMAGPWMRPGYLLPVHDFEAGDGIRTDNEMAQFAIDFSNRIYEVMGIRPAIYVSGNYANYVLGGASQSLRNQVVTAYPTLWSARWPNQDNPDAIDVQNGHPGDSISWVYGPWDDYGVTHPWAFWQYTSRGRLQSFNNGGSNLDFDVAHGGIEFVKDNLVPAIWMNNNSGQWTALSNWNSGQTPVAPVQGPGQVPRVGSLTLPATRLPGSNDTVILDRPNANITVTLGSGTHNIRKLYVREMLNLTGGSLTVNYAPTSDSTPIAAQFSERVSIGGNASLNVHTLQVDATRDFVIGDSTLSFNRINLMPHGTAPAEIHLSGNVSFNPLNNAAAVIANGAGTGSSGRIQLTPGQNHVLNIGDGSAAEDLAINVPILGDGFTKAGAGTLALYGLNNYDGDTIVQAGRLSVASPNGLNQQFDNEWDIHLSTGAILDLMFSGTPDTIGSLFIDGASQPAGIWGAEGSGAPFTSPLITGTGRLEVTRFIPPPLAGDFNDDGRVDMTDYIVWRKMDGTPSGYDDWRTNFGRTSPGAGSGSKLGENAAAPEPSAVVMLILGIAMVVARRHR
ncbi:MAG TPA: GH25 family lysozyme [Lacipirellulaceae bacterium]